MLPLDERSPEGCSLELLVREGARRMLAAALEAEVGACVDQYQPLVDSRGRRLIVRNGYLPEREILTSAGSLKVKAPRVRDRRGAGHEDAVVFTSGILPRYIRKSKAINGLIP